MSDYMFVLENHLNAEQGAFLAALQAVCGETGVNVFLTGGAMRDVLGGFPVRDLDFTVEGDARKIAVQVAQRSASTIVATDELRNAVELVLKDGSTVQLAMARRELYKKAGGRPTVTPATIHDDLNRRDFTINAVALSVGRASRGLLLDPANGLGDLERRELRAVTNYVFYDDPVRLWRLIRLKVRLGFQIDERTARQYANAREAGMDRQIPPAALREQLRQIASEPNPGDILNALSQEKLLDVVSPALGGPKLNLPGFAKLLKTRHLVPFGVTFAVDEFALLLELLQQKLSPKERSALVAALELDKEDLRLVTRMEAAAKKLESAAKSARLQKASQVYQVLSGAPGEVILHLFMTTSERIVQDRIRNYLQKYLPAAAEITDKEIEAEGLKPGTPKFIRRKQEKIAARLDARPKKPAPPPPEVAPVAPAPNVRRAG